MRFERWKTQLNHWHLCVSDIDASVIFLWFLSECLFLFLFLEIKTWIKSFHSKAFCYALWKKTRRHGSFSYTSRKTRKSFQLLLTCVWWTVLDKRIFMSKHLNKSTQNPFIMESLGIQQRNKLFFTYFFRLSIGSLVKMHGRCQNSSGKKNENYGKSRRNFAFEFTNSTPNNAKVQWFLSICVRIYLSVASVQRLQFEMCFLPFSWIWYPSTVQN